MAALTKKELGIEPRLEEGRLGEFTVWVGGKVAARKGWLRFPPDEKMLAAVRQRLST